ncbi:putative redoxin domain-containing protein [Botryosphaeria dothidea]|uniref:Redoxin domain-containing protein n=1 Tax=Botryosphaeria dothidea TaxID=55169 RepID=A0A8H4IUC4_9PEZI|nr:putative redoxin domain-containing protein [Botryosphaeria dothidea]
MEQQLQQQSDHVLHRAFLSPWTITSATIYGARPFPSVPLLSTEGKEVDVSKLEGYTIIFCYPRTGKPKETRCPPTGTPSRAPVAARPQACSFKAATSQLKGLGITNIFGLSTQDTEHQKICREHLRLGYHLLSDEMFKLCEGLASPHVRNGEDMRLVKRVTLLVDHGKIVWIDYPVFQLTRVRKRLLNSWRSSPPTDVGNPRCGNEPSPACIAIDFLPSYRRQYIS